MELMGVLWEAFLLGLVTPLGAVCVLPIYPGFLVYLSNQTSTQTAGRKTIFLFGVIITFGVILFMFLLGLVFTTILEVSLTNVVQIVSPIAFGILLIISLVLIVTGIISLTTDKNIDNWRFLPKGHIPVTRNHWSVPSFTASSSAQLWCRVIPALSPYFSPGRYPP